jgi:hypothetical protein
MIKSNFAIIGSLKTFLENAVDNKKRYCRNSNDFTRKKKLTFVVVVMFTINLAKRSLSIEIENYVKKMSTWDSIEEFTKSAFSQARYKLKHVFYQDWNDELTKEFYTDNDEGITRWKGFIVQGIDGSTKYLPDTDEIRNEFGVQANQAGSVPMARTMFCYDVLNDICVKSRIGSIYTDELTVGMDWVSDYRADTLSIYDRYYMSFALLYVHDVNNKAYVIRCPKNFNKATTAFELSGADSAIVEIPATETGIRRLKTMGYEIDLQTSVKVRLVRVLLDTGETEVLVTSLSGEDEYPTSEFKALYFLRWGVETAIDAFKNKFQIEIFSGHYPEAIRQDFYAAIFTYNIQSLVIGDCKEELQKATADNQHEYQTNRNVTLGLLKDEILGLFSSASPKQIYEELKRKFIKYREPVRKNRQYKRGKGKKRLNGKYQTSKNHRRAI